jgi:hypothetical protein
MIFSDIFSKSTQFSHDYCSINLLLLRNYCFYGENEYHTLFLYTNFFLQFIYLVLPMTSRSRVIRNKPFASHALVTTFSIWWPKLTSVSRVVLILFSDRIHKYTCKAFTFYKMLCFHYLCHFREGPYSTNQGVDQRIILENIFVM